MSVEVRRTDEVGESIYWVLYWKEKREKIENGRRDEGDAYYTKMNKEQLRQEILMAQDNKPLINVLMRGRKITKTLLITVLRMSDDIAIEDFKEQERKAGVIMVSLLKKEMEKGEESKV